MDIHLYYIWYFLIGGFLANGMPHFIWGISKPIVHIRWGLANFIAATVLSFWQISANNVSDGAIIALLIGFWFMTATFGFGIKLFLNS